MAPSHPASPFSSRKSADCPGVEGRSSPLQTPETSSSFFRNLHPRSSSPSPSFSSFLRSRLGKEGSVTVTQSEEQTVSSSSSSSLFSTSSSSYSSRSSRPRPRPDSPRDLEDSRGDTSLPSSACRNEAHDIAVLRQYMSLFERTVSRKKRIVSTRRVEERRTPSQRRERRKDQKEAEEGRKFHRASLSSHQSPEDRAPQAAEGFRGDDEEEDCFVYNGDSFWGVQTPAGETLRKQLTFRMRSTLQLLLLLRQMEILGNRLRRMLGAERKSRRKKKKKKYRRREREVPQREGWEDEEEEEQEEIVGETVAAWEERSEMSEGQALRLIFARYRSVQVLTALECWLQWEARQLRREEGEEEEENGEEDGLFDREKDGEVDPCKRHPRSSLLSGCLYSETARSDFFESSLVETRLRSVQSEARQKKKAETPTTPGREEKKDQHASPLVNDVANSVTRTFYHADWPYILPKALSSSSSALSSSGLAAERGRRRGGVFVSLVDKANCHSFYKSIWRLVRSGLFLEAENLAVQRGASWLVEVLRGDDAWLEPYVPFDGSLSSSASSSLFSAADVSDILTDHEVQVLSDSNSLLKTCIWPSGFSLRDVAFLLSTLPSSSSSLSSRPLASLVEGASARPSLPREKETDSEESGDTGSLEGEVEEEAAMRDRAIQISATRGSGGGEVNLASSFSSSWSAAGLDKEKKKELLANQKEKKNERRSGSSGGSSEALPVALGLDLDRVGRFGEGKKGRSLFIYACRRILSLHRSPGSSSSSSASTSPFSAFGPSSSSFSSFSPRLSRALQKYHQASSPSSSSFFSETRLSSLRHSSSCPPSSSSLGGSSSFIFPFSWSQQLLVDREERGFVMDRYERALYGFLSGDLESMQLIVQDWNECLLCLVRALKACVVEGTLRCLRSHQPHRRFAGEATQGSFAFSSSSPPPPLSSSLSSSSGRRRASSSSFVSVVDGEDLDVEEEEEREKAIDKENEDETREERRRPSKDGGEEGRGRFAGVYDGFSSSFFFSDEEERENAMGRREKGRAEEEETATKRRKKKEEEEERNGGRLLAESFPKFPGADVPCMGTRAEGSSSVGEGASPSSSSFSSAEAPLLGSLRRLLSPSSPPPPVRPSSPSPSLPPEQAHREKMEYRRSAGEEEGRSRQGVQVFSSYASSPPRPHEPLPDLEEKEDRERRRRRRRRRKRRRRQHDPLKILLLSNLMGGGGGGKKEAKRENLREEEEESEGSFFLEGKSSDSSGVGKGGKSVKGEGGRGVRDRREDESRSERKRRRKRGQGGEGGGEEEEECETDGESSGACCCGFAWRTEEEEEEEEESEGGSGEEEEECARQVDQGVLTLLFNLMNDLPLFLRRFIPSEGARRRVEVEAEDDLRLLQLMVVFYFLSDEGRRSEKKEDFSRSSSFSSSSSLPRGHPSHLAEETQGEAPPVAAASGNSGDSDEAPSPSQPPLQNFAKNCTRGNSSTRGVDKEEEEKEPGVGASMTPHASRHLDVFVDGEAPSPLPYSEGGGGGCVPLPSLEKKERREVSSERKRKRMLMKEERDDEEEERNAKTFYFSNIRKLLRKASKRGPRLAVYGHLNPNRVRRCGEEGDGGEEEDQELVSVLCKPCLSLQDFIAFFVIMQGDLKKPFLPSSSSSPSPSYSLSAALSSPFSWRTFEKERKGSRRNARSLWQTEEEFMTELSPPSASFLTKQDINFLVGTCVVRLLEELEVFDVLLHVKLRELLRHLSSQYRVKILGDWLWRKFPPPSSPSFSSSSWQFSDKRPLLGACVTWICTHFPHEILLVLSFLSEKCWEISRPVLVRQPDPSTRERRDEEGGRAQDSSRTTAVVGMDPRRLLEQEEEEEKLSRGEGRYFGFDGEDYTLSFDEVKIDVALDRLQFSIYLYLSVFSLFYLDRRFQPSAHTPLLLLRRKCPSSFSSSPFASLFCSSSSSSLDLLLLGLYCLGIVAHLGLLGMSLEIRSLLHSFALLLSPSSLSSSSSSCLRPARYLGVSSSRHLEQTTSLAPSPFQPFSSSPSSLSASSSTFFFRCCRDEASAAPSLSPEEESKCQAYCSFSSSSRGRSACLGDWLSYAVEPSLATPVVDLLLTELEKNLPPEQREEEEEEKKNRPREHRRKEGGEGEQEEGRREEEEEKQRDTQQGEQKKSERRPTAERESEPRGRKKDLTHASSSFPDQEEESGKKSGGRSKESPNESDEESEKERRDQREARHRARLLEELKEKFVSGVSQISVRRSGAEGGDVFWIPLSSLHQFYDLSKVVALQSALHASLDEELHERRRRRRRKSSPSEEDEGSREDVAQEEFPLSFPRGDGSQDEEEEDKKREKEEEEEFVQRYLALRRRSEEALEKRKKKERRSAVLVSSLVRVLQAGAALFGTSSLFKVLCRSVCTPPHLKRERGEDEEEERENKEEVEVEEEEEEKEGENKDMEEEEEEEKNREAEGKADEEDSSSSFSSSSSFYFIGGDGHRKAADVFFPLVVDEIEERAKEVGQAVALDERFQLEHLRHRLEELIRIDEENRFSSAAENREGKKELAEHLELMRRHDGEQHREARPIDGERETFLAQGCGEGVDDSEDEEERETGRLLSLFFMPHFCCEEDEEENEDEEEEDVRLSTRRGWRTRRGGGGGAGRKTREEEEGEQEKRSERRGRDQTDEEDRQRKEAEDEDEKKREEEWGERFASPLVESPAFFPQLASAYMETRRRPCARHREPAEEEEVLHSEGKQTSERWRLEEEEVESRRRRKRAERGGRTHRLSGRDGDGDETARRRRRRCSSSSLLLLILRSQLLGDCVQLVIMSTRLLSMSASSPASLSTLPFIHGEEQDVDAEPREAREDEEEGEAGRRQQREEEEEEEDSPMRRRNRSSLRTLQDLNEILLFSSDLFNRTVVDYSSRQACMLQLALAKGDFRSSSLLSFFCQQHQEQGVVEEEE